MRTVVICLLAALSFFPGELCSQSGMEPGDSRIRLGLHGGMQSGVLRYSVFPYSGEFQSMAEHGAVKGISLGLPLADDLRLHVDAGWWSHTWAARHDGDPQVAIDRGSRSFVEFPVLLMYHPGVLPIPLYLAAGPVISFLTGENPAFTVSYTSFVERDGWTTTRRAFVEERVHFAMAVESGIEAPLSDALFLQLGVRYSQPLANTIETTTLSLRELSVWRIRLGLLWAL